MRRIIACGAVALVPMVGAAVAQGAKAPSHTMVTAGDLKWGEPPPLTYVESGRGPDQTLGRKVGGRT